MADIGKTMQEMAEEATKQGRPSVYSCRGKDYHQIVETNTGNCLALSDVGTRQFGDMCFTDGQCYELYINIGSNDVYNMTRAMLAISDTR